MIRNFQGFTKQLLLHNMVFLGCKGPELKANTTEKIHGVLLILFQQGHQILTINRQKFDRSGISQGARARI